MKWTILEKINCNFRFLTSSGGVFNRLTEKLDRIFVGTHQPLNIFNSQINIYDILAKCILIETFYKIYIGKRHQSKHSIIQCKPIALK